MAPISISNHTASGIMDIVWPDGARQQLQHAFLRGNCPCADCKAARAGEGEKTGISPGTRIVRIIPVGAYAVQLIFSDGHLRGIFPWAYLKQLGGS